MENPRRSRTIEVVAIDPVEPAPTPVRDVSDNERAAGHSALEPRAFRPRSALDKLFRSLPSPRQEMPKKGRQLFVIGDFLRICARTRSSGSSKVLPRAQNALSLSSWERAARELYTGHNLLRRTTAHASSATTRTRDVSWLPAPRSSMSLAVLRAHLPCLFASLCASLHDLLCRLAPLGLPPDTLAHPGPRRPLVAVRMRYMLAPYLGGDVRHASVSGHGTARCMAQPVALPITDGTRASVVAFDADL
ncbi:hypothetical protein C8T65DRAFT_738213 [Cerioporus squamosus]|nr:hypothetical protein C8T65DRAFT_738213 [Cerioporus squamosus]